MVRVALPAERLAVPIELPPSMKITVPLGEPELEMLAVKTRLWPTVTCVVDALKDVVVTAGGGCVMRTVTTAEVEAASAESPPYCAVIMWEPTLSVEMVRMAFPPDKVALPIEAPLSVKVTVPPNELEPETAAVRTMLFP